MAELTLEILKKHADTVLHQSWSEPTTVYAYSDAEIEAAEALGFRAVRVLTLKDLR